MFKKFLLNQFKGTFANKKNYLLKQKLFLTFLKISHLNIKFSVTLGLIFLVVYTLIVYIIIIK